MARNALIQVRRDTAANWTSVNPTLAAGEQGFETDTGKFKIGTGSTAWTSLLYATDGSDITGATLASNVTGSSLTSVGTLTGLTIGGAGANRSITINAPSGYYAIQYFAINGTNKWHYEVDPAGTRWALVESGVAERIGVTNAGATFSGTITSTQFLQGTDYLSPYQGFRNKIINGSFEVWQRGTARTFMQAGTYLADRWTVRQYQQNAHQRTAVTPVTGMQTRYALRSSSSTTAEVAGGTRMYTNTALESGDTIPLRSQTMTLSFWVRFSSATCSSSTATPYGNWSGSIEWNTSTTDSGMGTTGVDGGSGITLTNGSLPTTWTKYTVSGTVPSTANNVGVGFGFAGLGSTASANTVWYEITQVQLEVGSVATPFEQRPIQQELAMCQRYYEQVGSITSTSYAKWISGEAFMHIPFKVTKRASPTMALVSGSWTSYNVASSFASGTPIVSDTNVNGFNIKTHTVSTEMQLYLLNALISASIEL